MPSNRTTARRDPAHHLHVDEVGRLLGVNPAEGLSDAEVTLRRRKFGPNRITPLPGTPAWKQFLHQFHQPLIYLLIAACAVTAFLREWVDASVIFGVVFVNAMVGYLQESRAGRAVEALTRMITTQATVRRAGVSQRIDADELVPGDVVLLEAGDRVPADMRLYRAKNLQMDESALTGESSPAAKHPDPLALETTLADRRNMAFTGALVTSGQGTGVVWATGDATETGHIARLVETAEELTTPLTRKIAHFSRQLLWVILAVAAVTFTIGVLRGEDVVQMFMAAVTLAVGAIPEGLPAAVTIVLAIGVGRMARRQAIIRRLPAVETLGSTTVVCSDKTGTLTENQMTVQEIFVAGETYAITGTGYDSTGEIRLDGVPVNPAQRAALAECLLAAALCNDARLVQRNGRWEAEGDPTEAALLAAAAKSGLVVEDQRGMAPRVDAIPFASEHMFRATLHDTRLGRMIYKVGAAERLFNRCTEQLDARGDPVPFDRASAQAALEAMAGRGLRVLAVAQRQTDGKHNTLEHHHVASGLTFLGLQGMMDPPRPEAIASVRRCREAGIAVKMITGDHLATACAVAARIGLGGPDGQLPVALSGRELAQVPDSQLPEVAERTVVFARVDPEQKLRLVRALQSRGHIVAMTGDGVNDAPALKQADIGVAMGRSGTDVAKGAADMILADDNFASIEAAVEEGRGVYENLTKFIVWIIPTNVGESLLVLTAVSLALPLPVLPSQLLWINLTDTLLGLPFAFEPAERDLMQRPPRPPGQPILTPALLRRTLLVCTIMLGGTFWLFLWELHAAGASLAVARTAVVNVIVAVEVVYLFNCRALHRSFHTAPAASNHLALASAGGMVAAQLLFTYLPALNRLFHTAPLGPATWVRIAAVALTAFLAVELEKSLCSRRPGVALPISPTSSLP
ncbi:MAG: putative cation-transporting ATPase [Verrucomicrobiota bacterium]|jgi:Ca2+-transporting ATPase